MYSWKRYIPEGARDLLFESCSAKNEIVKNLRDLYIKSGFLEIASPTLEFYDVFQGEGMAIEQEKMYKFFDNQGRILVLRPDMTIPIARIVATKLKESQYPVRICYGGNIFRMNENWEGKVSEITQSGIEIIGIQNPRVDAEVIMLAIQALLSIGIKNFKLEIGQAEFFKSLIEDAAMSEEEIEKIRILTENKNFAALREFVDMKEKVLGKRNVEILKRLPELFGGIEVLEKAKVLTGNEGALKALKNIQEIYEILDAVGLSNYISIDLGMVQHIHYYTGVIFKGYCGEIGSPILSGGRYDALLTQFGADIPASGFAIQVDHILSALERLEEKEVKKEMFLIHYENFQISKAYELAQRIRKSGKNAELSFFESTDEVFRYAKYRKINKIIRIFGEDVVEIVEVETKSCLRMNECALIEKLEE